MSVLLEILAPILRRLATRWRHRDDSRAVERACGLDASTAAVRAQQTVAAAQAGRMPERAGRSWPFTAGRD